MTAVIATDYGEVEVTFYSEPGQPWGGALVHAPDLLIGDITCVARLYVSRDGSTKHQVGTFPEDDDAFDIIVPGIEDNTDLAVKNIYLTGHAREHVLLILCQAFAEATYLPEFQQAQRHAKGRELTNALRERNALNQILDRALVELKSLEVFSPAASLQHLPDYFFTSEQHNDALNDPHLLREHLGMFALTPTQESLVDNQATGLDALKDIHTSLCPLTRP